MVSRNDRHDRILDLIGAVYDAALDEKLWPALAPHIARTFDATATAVHVRQAAANHIELLALTDNYDEAAIQRYQQHFGRLDVFVDRAAELGMPAVITSREMISDADLERTEFCADWLRAIDVFYLVGSLFPIGGGDLGALGVLRPRNGEAFTEADKASVARFLPHLARALQLRRRLGGAAIKNRIATDFLDRSGVATLVAARDGRILHSNPAAELLLRQRSLFRTANDRLSAPDRRIADRLAMLVQVSADTAAGRATGSGGMLSVPRAGRLPLTLLVAPFPAAKEGLGVSLPAAIVFIRDPEATTPKHVALQSLFGLTSAEAAVAVQLAEGQAVDAIAAGFGISLNTARSHLKSTYLKTGTSRQAQLVALLLRSVAVLAQPPSP